MSILSRFHRLCFANFSFVLHQVLVSICKWDAGSWNNKRHYLVPCFCFSGHKFEHIFFFFCSFLHGFGSWKCMKIHFYAMTRETNLAQVWSSWHGCCQQLKCPEIICKLTALQVTILKGPTLPTRLAYSGRTKWNQMFCKDILEVPFFLISHISITLLLVIPEETP